MERNKGENNRTSLLMLVCSMGIFGTIGIFRRQMSFSSGMIACVRGLSGALFLTLFVKLRGKALFHETPKRIILLMLFSGAVIGINWILLFEAYRFTTVSVATLCYYMEPVIVMCAAALLFREKMSMRQWVCVAVAFCGMLLISGVGGTLFSGTAGASGTGMMGADPVKGILLGLAAACLYSTVVLMNRLFTGTDAYEKTIVQLFAAGVVLLPYLFFTKGEQGAAPDLNSVLLLLLMGILHTGIAYALYFGSMEGLRTQTIALCSYIDPVVALVLSAVILQERMERAGIVGAVLILGAAVVSETVHPSGEGE